MKPTEIRIGNTLMSCLTKAPIIVDWLVIKHIADGNIQNGYDISPVYEPIPLTEEILLKCGFNKGRLNFIGYYYYDLPKCRTLLVSIELHEIHIYFSANIEILIAENIQSLHQLQNLFYILTGEELTITL